MEIGKEFLVYVYPLVQKRIAQIANAKREPTIFELRMLMNVERRMREDLTS